MGPRDLANGICIFARRGVKTQVKLDDVRAEAKKTLEEFQKVLYDKAYQRLQSNTFIENDYGQFKETRENPWFLSAPLVRIR